MTENQLYNLGVGFGLIIIMTAIAVTMLALS